MKELTLQQVADLFGCFACVNKYEEDRILLFDRHPYYNKDSGTYGGRYIGWVSNLEGGILHMVATPKILRRPSVRRLIDSLECTLVIRSKQTIIYSDTGKIQGTIATRSLLFGIGVSKDEGKIVCHSQCDVAI